MLLFLLYDVDRFALICVLLTIFGSINVLQLRNRLMIWEMSSVLQCARDGWLILLRPSEHAVAIGQGELVVPDDE